MYMKLCKINARYVKCSMKQIKKIVNLSNSGQTQTLRLASTANSRFNPSDS